MKDIFEHFKSTFTGKYFCMGGPWNLVIPQLRDSKIGQGTWLLLLPPAPSTTVNTSHLSLAPGHKHPSVKSRSPPACSEKAPECGDLGF